MSIFPYINFNGTCAAAFDFYALCLNTEINEISYWGHSPACDSVPPEWHEKVIHANIKIGNGLLMASDAPPGSYEKPQGISIAFITQDIAEAERVFTALSQGATITMPLEQTFWAERFGMLTDKFGISWMVNCETGERA